MSWALAKPGNVDMYRARTAVSAPVTLRRKRCACGKVVTAKQIIHQGGCDACAHAAAAKKAA
jgi:hypothetical protein